MGNACKLAAISPCSGVGDDGVCTVFYPEGVLARINRFKCCAYQDVRKEQVKAKNVQKLNPLKASKRG